VKRVELNLAVASFLAISLWSISKPPVSLRSAPQRTVQLSGEIMDSKCAIEGSHEQMMKKMGLQSVRDCTLACAQNDGSFVLLDSDTKEVYQLDDQKKPEAFAGQRVTISGSYDEQSQTIHVQSIQPASKSRPDSVVSL
jgi:hypothetical protein